MFAEELQKLGKKVNDVFGDLEVKIKEGLDKHEGVAELKEQVNKASQDIASSHEALTKLRDELNKRQDDFEIAMKEKTTKKQSAAFKSVSDIVIAEDLKYAKGYTRDDDGVEIAARPDMTLANLKRTQGTARVYRFKSWGLSRAQRILRAYKNVTDANGSAGQATDALRIAQIVPPPQRRLMVRDLFLIGRTDEAAVEFVRENTFVGTPAPQAAQGDTKQVLDATFVLVTAPVRTIAGYIKASTQILSDVSQMQSYLDGRLTQKLGEAEEAQLLLGTGASGAVEGVIPTATAYDSALETTLVSGTVTPVDRVKVAITQVFNLNGIPDGIMLSPQDWAQIELSKTDDGAYLFVNPQTGADPSLWGLPVVPTNALAAPQAVVGPWSSAAQIWDKEDANVTIATTNEDDFIKNMITMKAEERIALTKYQPTLFVEFNTDGSGS